MGSSGLRENRGPADPDRAGPPVPEPLSISWLHLKSPRALTPSSDTVHPLDPVRDNLEKTTSIFLKHGPAYHEPLTLFWRRHRRWRRTGVYHNSESFSFMHIFEMTRQRFYNLTLLSVYAPPSYFAKLSYKMYSINRTHEENLALYCQVLSESTRLLILWQ